MEHAANWNIRSRESCLSKILKNEIKSITFQYERVNESLKKVTKLEKVKEKLESDNIVIRKKIKGILNDLEQIDFVWGIRA